MSIINTHEAAETPLGAVPAPVPADERLRLESLESYGILDTLPEQCYDDITALASHICDTPIALVSLVDEKRQWFKSRIGLEATETPRDVAFCAHAILEPEELFVVPDATADPRFAANPLVVEEPGIRFYAGAPLVTAEGHALGTLCVIARDARQIGQRERDALLALARQVVSQLDLRKTLSELHASSRELAEYARQLEGYQQKLEGYQRKLEAGYESMRAESVTDPLTGIANRRAFGQRLEEEADRARRFGHDLSLVVVDVDRFKDFNDGYGHLAGDEVLRMVSEIILTSSRIHDFVARYGGEEFAIILPDTDIDGAHVLAERYRFAVQRADWEHRHVTISAGVATQRGDAVDPQLLFAAADDAMYRAKEKGRNQIVAAP